MNYSKINRTEFFIFQELYGENKEILGFKDFIRNYLEEVLEENGEIKENKKKLLKGYIKNLGEYQKIAKDKGLELDLLLIKKVVFGQSLEEFKEFLEDEDVQYLLELPKITEKLLIIFNLDGLNNRDKFLKISKNLYFIDFIEYSDINTFKNIINIMGFITINEFITFINQTISCKKLNFINFVVLSYTDVQLKYIFNFLGIKCFNVSYDNKKNNTNIFEILKKYKSNYYIGLNGIIKSNINYQPYNLIDSKYNLYGDEKVGDEIKFDGINSFIVNNKKSTKLQKILNRIFSPIMPMTKIISLKNKEFNLEKIVSIDVENDKNGKKISGFKENISNDIKIFFRMIYQFLAVDFDRIYNNLNNISRDGIIYDFDYFFNPYIFIDPKIKSFGKDNETYYEYGYIIYGIKKYLLSEIKELNKIYEKDNDIKNFLKILNKNINFLNFENLLKVYEIYNYNLLTFAKKFDRKFG